MGRLYYLKKTDGARSFSRAKMQAGSRLKCWFLAVMLTAVLPFSASAQQDLLNTKIYIPRQNTTLYEAFNQITAQAGCLFIYDSQVVESDKRVKLEADHIALGTLLHRLLDNPRLAFKVIGNHILIFKENQQLQALPPAAPVAGVADSVRHIVVKGFVYDNLDKKPVPYAAIGILEQNLGTITNAEGYFVLKIPARFAGSNLQVSHLGYLSQSIPVSLLEGQKIDVFLDRRIISIQEVIIQYIDPAVIVARAVEDRYKNYSEKPVYLTSFYREGVYKNNRCLNYTEAVFRVYKSAFDVSESNDQVKLLKSRKVQNASQNDTVFLKLKGGILSGLQLDIAKVLPGFLDPVQSGSYIFNYSDIVSNDMDNAYAVTFEQNPDITEPLYTGTLYIDRQNFAILAAEFEINPKYLHKAVGDLIIKKSPKLTVKLEKISYSVAYRQYQGRYYLNHARCDIRLKTRLRNRISSDNFSTFLETATCNIDTLNIERFAKQQVIKPGVVFSDVTFNYDESFWGNYNIITPEARLNEALSRIISKIEQIE